MEEKKVDRRIRRTKKQFQQALLELMWEKEFEDITVTDIAKHADYNRATFYRHYDFKEQLAEAIITEQVNGLIETIKYPYKKTNHIYLHTLSPSKILIFDHIIKNSLFYKLWDKFVAMPRFEENFLDALTQFFRDEIVLVVPADPKLDDNLYTSFYANGILGIIINWIQNGLEPSADYMAKQLVKILNHYPGESYIANTVVNTGGKMKMI